MIVAIVHLFALLCFKQMIGPGGVTAGNTSLELNEQTSKQLASANEKMSKAAGVPRASKKKDDTTPDLREQMKVVQSKRRRKPRNQRHNFRRADAIRTPTRASNPGELAVVPDRDPTKRKTPDSSTSTPSNNGKVPKAKVDARKSSTSIPRSKDGKSLPKRVRNSARIAIKASLEEG